MTNRNHRAILTMIVAFGLSSSQSTPVARAQVSDAVACINAIAPMLQISLLSQGAVSSSAEASAWACNSSESELDARVGLKLLEKFGFDASTAQRLKELSCGSSSSSSSYSASDLLIVTVLSPAAADTLRVCTELKEQHDVVFQSKSLLDGKAVSLSLRQGNFLPTRIYVTDIRVTGPGGLSCDGPLWNAVRRREDRPGRRVRIPEIFTHIVCERTRLQLGASGDEGQVVHPGAAVVITTDAGALIWQFDPLPAPNSANVLSELAYLRSIVEQLTGGDGETPMLKKFATSWVAVGQNQDVSIVHNLGSTEVLVAIYYSRTGSDADAYGPVPFSWREHNPQFVSGAVVSSLSPSSLNVRTGNDFRSPAPAPGADAHITTTNGFIKVLVLALG